MSPRKKGPPCPYTEGQLVRVYFHKKNGWSGSIPAWFVREIRRGKNKGCYQLRVPEHHKARGNKVIVDPKTVSPMGSGKEAGHGG